MVRPLEALGISVTVTFLLLSIGIPSDTILWIAIGSVSGTFLLSIGCDVGRWLAKDDTVDDDDDEGVSDT